jgi:hypothetical protein
VMLAVILEHMALLESPTTESIFDSMVKSRNIRYDSCGYWLSQAIISRVTGLVHNDRWTTINEYHEALSYSLVNNE